MCKQISNGRFSEALGDYSNASDELARLAALDGPTDEELGRSNDRQINAALGLVQSGAKGPEAARILLEIAVERIRADDPAALDLEPTNNFGIDDRLDVAFITAALAALTPEVVEDAEGAAPSETSPIQNDEIMTELRDLARVEKGVVALGSDLIPGRPGSDEVDEAGRRLFKRMEALTLDLLSRPAVTLDDVRRRAEAVTLCWPSLMEDDDDPRDRMVGALLRSLGGALTSATADADTHV